MKWSKKGHIFSVSGNFGWMNSHAQVPTVLLLEDRLRVYFSSREVAGKSMTTFLDTDILDPTKILYIHDKPIIESGLPGTFDEHGIMPSDVVTIGDLIYLYYSGWSKRSSVPYSNLTGIAVSEDKGVSFKRLFDGPILSTDHNEPYSATSPSILFYQGQYLMWYCSGTGWLKVNERYEHIYDIKSASSCDGITWCQHGESKIPLKHNTEALTRPVVFEHKNRFHMLFSFRGCDDFRDGKDSYQMGYAWSNDLEHWSRDDDAAGITLAETGWDSKMIAYPYVVETPFGVYLFYNGNGFGTSGFGYAVLET